MNAACRHARNVLALCLRLERERQRLQALSRHRCDRISHAAQERLARLEATVAELQAIALERRR